METRTIGFVRRGACAALAGVLLLSLAACGGKSPSAADSGVSEPAASDAAASDADTAAPETALTRYQKQIRNELATIEELEPYTSIRPEDVPDNPESDFVIETGSGYTWITGYVGTSTQVKIPADLGGATESILIREDAFKKNESITWLYLPESVHMVNENAFRSCTALQEVYVMGATEIEQSAFKNCTALRRVALGGCQEIKGDIGGGAFEACEALTEVVFPRDLTAIGTNAFFGCIRLQEADLSQTQLSRIGQQAFTECLQMKSLSLPASLDAISPNACLKCYSLSEINVDPACESYFLEDGVLYYGGPEVEPGKYWAAMSVPASGIQDIAIKDGTEMVLSNAFGYNAWVEHITLPDSCTVIEPNGFNSCGSLKSFDFGQGVEEIKDYAFQYCISLEEVDLPASCKVLGDAAFAWIGSALQKVTLPDGITYAGDATTDRYVFSCDNQATFTYQGKDYTYDEAADWNLK